VLAVCLFAYSNDKRWILLLLLVSLVLVLVLVRCAVAPLHTKTRQI